MSSLGRVALPLLTALSAPLLLKPAPALAKRMPPRPACLEGAGLPRFLELRGDALELCVAGEGADSETVSCYLMNLTSGQLRRTAARAPAAPYKLELGDDDVQICATSGPPACKTIRASGEVDPGLGLAAELNSDGTKIVLAYMGADTTVETFEVATGKRLMQTSGRAKNAMCIYGSFTGDSVLVQERDCGADGLLASWLAGPDGKRLADAGGGKAFATTLEPAHVSGDTWAFAAARGEAVALQDVETGKVKKKVTLGKKGPRAAVVADDKRVVAAYEGARLGEVAVIELATYKVKKLSAPRCGR